MFAVSEIAPHGLPAGQTQTQTQAQLIASVAAQQRVISAQAGAESGDASARNFPGNNFSGNSERNKELRDAERMKQRAELDSHSRTPDATALADRSAEARSIVEAQEASMTDRKIVAAFQARHGLTDLLSVIRDPEDRLLPSAPEE